MNLVIGSNTLGAYRPITRPAFSRTIEQAYDNPATRVPTDVASLSLQTRIDLSQKANVVPPPPPADNRRKVRDELPGKKSQVSTTDFTGRTCTGSLHGPLLMEDPLQQTEERPSGFQSSDFVFTSPEDFAPLRSASLALAALQPEILQAPATGQPLATLPAADSSFLYFGVKDGQALMVQQFENEAPAGAASSQVQLPDGRLAQILRQGGEQSQFSIYLPAESLGEMAMWGYGLLAEG